LTASDMRLRYFVTAGCRRHESRLLRGKIGCGTARPILWWGSGKLHAHRLAEDMANGIGIAVLFDMPEFSLAPDDGFEVVVAEFGLNGGLAWLAGHGSLHLDWLGAAIAPVWSRDEE